MYLIKSFAKLEFIRRVNIQQISDFLIVDLQERALADEAEFRALHLVDQREKVFECPRH